MLLFRQIDEVIRLFLGFFIFVDSCFFPNMVLKPAISVAKKRKNDETARLDNVQSSANSNPKRFKTVDGQRIKPDNDAGNSSKFSLNLSSSTNNTSSTSSGSENNSKSPKTISIHHIAAPKRGKKSPESIKREKAEKNLIEFKNRNFINQVNPELFNFSKASTRAEVRARYDSGHSSSICILNESFREISFGIIGDDTIDCSALQETQASFIPNTPEAEKESRKQKEKETQKNKNNIQDKDEKVKNALVKPNFSSKSPVIQPNNAPSGYGTHNWVPPCKSKSPSSPCFGDPYQPKSITISSTSDDSKSSNESKPSMSPLPPRASSITPYQGTMRCFGRFNCHECPAKWVSIKSYANKGQTCRYCHTLVYPYTQNKLNFNLLENRCRLNDRPNPWRGKQNFYQKRKKEENVVKNPFDYQQQIQNTNRNRWQQNRNRQRNVRVVKKQEAKREPKRELKRELKQEFRRVCQW